MKRFRFSLRTLLLLPVPFVVVWTWIAWPQRTLNGLSNAIDDREFENATSMVHCENCSFEFGPTGIELTSDEMRRWSPSPFFVEQMEPQERDLADLVSGRRTYALLTDTLWYVDTVGRPQLTSYPRFLFIVERGTITLRCR